MCASGFTGSECESNIDECLSEPCLNFGECGDNVDGYLCDCAGTGYAGAECELPSVVLSPNGTQTYDLFHLGVILVSPSDNLAQNRTFTVTRYTLPDSRLPALPNNTIEVCFFA